MVVVVVVVVMVVVVMMSPSKTWGKWEESGLQQVISNVWQHANASFM